MSPSSPSQPDESPEETPQDSTPDRDRAQRQLYLDSIEILGNGDSKLEARSIDGGPRQRRESILTGPWVLIVGFGVIIAIGAALLKLPWSSATGTPITWTEAIFTSTSATTVTGLTVLNTANDFSRFGQVVILLLLQVGGVGFIAFSVLLFRIIGRRITLQTRFLVQESLGTEEVSGVINLALYVLGVTLMLEAAGAFLLWLRWRTAMPPGEAIWNSVFHAISSYCNAGFDLYSGTDEGVLFGFGTDVYTLGVMGILIVLGGFGITVVYDLWSSTLSRAWSMGTKLTVVMAFVLTAIGLTFIMLDPNLHRVIYAGRPWHERFVAGFFTIVSARTAGLTILPMEQLSEATQLLVLLWMFIGGAPASMAGGVSTSTVSVLVVAVLATARGHNEAISFGRSLPTETISKAVAIMTVSTILVVAVTLILSLYNPLPIFATGFEVVSAFANAGYSLAFTSNLDDFGRYLIAFTMFWGRLGPLTIVVALAQKETPTLIRYPEEPVILG